MMDSVSGAGRELPANYCQPGPRCPVHLNTDGPRHTAGSRAHGRMYRDDRTFGFQQGLTEPVKGKPDGSGREEGGKSIKGQSNILKQFCFLMGVRHATDSIP